MGRLERIVVVLLISAVAAYLFDSVPGGPASGSLRPPIEPRPPPSSPRAALPDPGPVLPPPATLDPIFGVRVEERRGNSTGTAFAIDPSGLWATARHVVHECQRIALRSSRGWVEARLVWHHEQADLAVLRSATGIPALALSTQPLRRGQAGFAIGYPQGRPGAVEGLLLGRSQMHAEGRFRGRAPTVSWAERARVPDFEGSLGGISGGPLLDNDGHVIGVIVAESPRRGRFETLAPELLDSLASAGARTRRATRNEGAGPALDSTILPRAASQLRDTMRVAQAACATR
jgi:S1-C subfamily serine protease